MSVPVDVWEIGIAVVQVYNLAIHKAKTSLPLGLCPAGSSFCICPIFQIRVEQIVVVMASNLIAMAST